MQTGNPAPEPAGRGSYASAAVAAVINAAESLGIDVAAVTARLKLTVPELADSRQRVPAGDVNRLWDELLHAQDALSLIDGSISKFSLFDCGTFPAAVVTAATKREALALLARYIRLFCDLIELDFIIDEHVVLLRLRNNPGLHWATRLLLILMVRAFGREMLRRDLVLHGALLNFPDRDFSARLEERLQTPVMLNANCTGLILDPVDLDRTSAFFSQTTHQALRHLAENALQALDSPLGLRVKDAIAELLGQDTPIDAEHLAGRLNMSSRTLQRRLAEDQRSISGYLDEVRIEAAKQALITSHKPIGLIAESVGFAYQASFNKFFQREVGMTPREYRQAQGVANIGGD